MQSVRVRLSSAMQAKPGLRSGAERSCPIRRPRRSTAASRAALADKATGADAARKYKELKEVWEAFKKTRDGEIVPAVKAGKVDAAKALAKGIQAERLGKMKELLSALGAK
jgi:hypothetical protein